MRTTKIILIMTLLLLSAINIAEAKVEISRTSDSYMRPWLETTYGNVPSAGHYTHWTVYIESDKTGFVNVGFGFDGGKKIVTVHTIPYSKVHVVGEGYMRTFTNKVNVTIEPPYK